MTDTTHTHTTAELHSARLARWRTIGQLVVLIVLAVAIGSVFYFVRWHWAVGGTLLFAVLMYTVVSSHSRSTAYTCQHCKQEVKAGTLTDFMSPHLADKKLLRCPHCGLTSWCVSK